MSHSMYGADRTTHLKIVVVALLCATAVAAVGIAARVDQSTGAPATASAQVKPSGPAIKAGMPVEATGHAPTTIR